MKTKYAITLILAGVLILSCARQADFPAPDSRFVAAVSGGVLGRNEPVKVMFTQSQDTSRPLNAREFTLSPAAKGVLSWQNEYTLVFTPSEPLRAGQHYRAMVNVGSIAPFSFDFMTSLPSLAVTMDPVIIDANGE